MIINFEQGDSYMPYIAFIDMIGTRASAMISNQEYTDAINDFTNSLKQVSSICQCIIYGYSDNAYIQIESLCDLVKFFRLLRDTLMNKHRYFTAAVDYGSLKAKRVPLDKRKGFSMSFTEPATVDIYMQQCHFSGIGVSLSAKVISDLIEQEMQNTFCSSIYQQPPINDCEGNIVSIYDLSYNPVILEKLKYIISDYLLTVATNSRAGRYYITPIISMIKCLDKNIIIKDLDKLIELLSFHAVPIAFRSIANNDKYSLFFLFALVEYVLSLREIDSSIDATEICQQIIKGYKIDHKILVNTLPVISTAVIANTHKRSFLNILYNMKQDDNKHHTKQLGNKDPQSIPSPYN